MRSLPLEHDPPRAWKSQASYACILLGVLVLNADGIGRSLWLDEAWVANSVREPTLQRMFYYPEWLQTSPPLFLLTARLAVEIFGLSTTVLRSVPLLFALIAGVAMLAAARRAVSAPFALLATAMLTFHPLPVEYFRSFKQYGAEMAATSLLLWAAAKYLKSPDRRRFLMLLGSTLLLLPLSNLLALLLPGVVLAVWFSGSRARAAVLAGVSGAALVALYFVFVEPNVAADLWAFWREGSDLRNGGGRLAVAIGAALVAYTVWRMASRAITWRDWMLLICMLPCVLLLGAELSGWYPASPRTRLFVRPCFLLALAIATEDATRRLRWRWLPAMVTLTAVSVLAWGLGKHFVEHRGIPHEDYIAAVNLLREKMATGDVLLAHASVRQGLRLYMDIEGWYPAVVYGDTGWPCCPRRRVTAQGSSTEQSVRNDLEDKYPQGTAGHVWLIYTGRPTHWKYTGINEGDLWRRLLAERGCPPGDYVEYRNLVIQDRICLN